MPKHAARSHQPKPAAPGAGRSQLQRPVRAEPRPHAQLRRQEKGINRREKDLGRREKKLVNKEQHLDELSTFQKEQLESLAALSRDEARAL